MITSVSNTIMISHRPFEGRLKVRNAELLLTSGPKEPFVNANRTLLILYVLIMAFFIVFGKYASQNIFYLWIILLTLALFLT